MVLLGKQMVKLVMQLNILWTGREYYSLENCLVEITPSGVDIQSVIVGKYESRIYRVEYHIKTNPDWETQFVQIISRHSNREQQFRLHKYSSDRWIAEGQAVHLFDGCTDVDIAVTPFTNTLPINRLKLNLNETQQVRVVYFDLLQQEVKPVQQQYTRLDELKYHYENIPNDFGADITVDENGFVVDYPSLFTRTDILQSSYNCHIKQHI
jgi:uncharacterized protein